MFRQTGMQGIQGLEQLTVGLAADHTKPHSLVFEDGENDHVPTPASIHHHLDLGMGAPYAEMVMSAKQDPMKVRKESSLSLAFSGFDVPLLTELFLSECDSGPYY